MSSPRDYRAFVSLLAALVPVDAQALKNDGSVGGYLALRVAADQYLQNGTHAFDIDFYRDERADGGVSTRLMAEPATDIARAWLVGVYAKAIVERFMTHGVLDLGRIQTAIVHDELLRVPHGQKIQLERAGLNAISLIRGNIPTRRLEGRSPAPDFELSSFRAGR